MVRADRTGPTRPGLTDWKIATRRVMFPSTISSMTMSALGMPDCGSAVSFGASRLSIFTARAGRAAFASSARRSPVSGATEPVAGCAVVVTASTGTDVLVVGFRVAAGSLSLPPPMTTTATSAMAATTTPPATSPRLTGGVRRVVASVVSSIG